jgi:hypothetical protein
VVDRDTPALGVRPDGEAALLEPLAHAFRAAGLEVTEHRPATAADVAALGSTWAKRLGIPERRPAWLLTARNRLC